MLKAELFQLLANGESSTLEFKRDDVRPEQLAEEVVALINHQGGQVLLGVEDDGGHRRHYAREIGRVGDGYRLRTLHPSLDPALLRGGCPRQR
ncbi:MAG: putative DNA binding domain-containing protein [Arhodomonas sp.]|nr:putative DNA binding domain-containing protein [Arhodomonas sp.]